MPPKTVILNEVWTQLIPTIWKYRGYALIWRGVRRRGGSFWGEIHANNPSSPLAPNTAMYVRQRLRLSKKDIPGMATELEAFAANATLSLQDLIDRAYSEPTSVRVSNPYD